MRRRRLAFLVPLFAVLLLTGCAIIPDALFGVFGDAYSGGGIDRAAKRQHYDDQLSRANSMPSNY
ncbi:MAG: hypothetical protein KDA44_13350 [Planctomycetales bacterium]|nr:hypothetical protein [Planctomycetales bacterium]